MSCALPLPDLEYTAEATITYLERRSSYMAKAPYIKNKPVTRKITDGVMYLSPATWLGPSILKAHNVHEYKRDRRQMEAAFVEYQQTRGDKKARPQAGAGMAMRPPVSISAPVSMVRVVGDRQSLSPRVVMERNSCRLSESSESSVPRARALFWEGGSNLFSPGLLQPWSPVGTTPKEKWDEDEESYTDSGYDSVLREEDPWMLPSIQMVL